MKLYLLFTIFIIFGLHSATNAQATVTNVSNNSVVEEDYYEMDCEEEEENLTAIFSTTEKEEPLRIYPNPTTEFISVTENSNVDYLHIYNIIGRRVKSFPVYEGGQYSLRDLPDGMYLVSMVDVNGKILKTVRTSKSVPRP